MVDKHKAPFPIGAQGVPQGSAVLRRDKALGLHRLHGGEQLPEVLEEQVQQVQQAVLAPCLPVLGEGRLEIVGEGRAVVGIAGLLGLVEGAKASQLVGAAVVHIVAGQVVPRPQLAQGQGVHVHGPDAGPPVVRHLDAPAQLAGGKGVALVGEAPAVWAGLGDLIGADSGVVAHPVEGEGVGGRQRLQGAGPGGVGVGAKDRQHLVHGDLGAADIVQPVHSPQGRLEAHLLGQAL